jgi:hypothetical protein
MEIEKCPHLGGTYSKGNPVKTKEADTEETSVHQN